MAQVLDALWAGWGAPVSGPGGRAAAAAAFQDTLCWAVARAPAVNKKYRDCFFGVWRCMRVPGRRRSHPPLSLGGKRIRSTCSVSWELMGAEQ